MSSIQLFSHETDTSAFIQDVLSSVNYELETFTAWSKADQVTSPIIVWDLDSFVQCNVEALTAIRPLIEDLDILGEFKAAL